MISSKLLLAYFLQTLTFGGLAVDPSNVDPEEAFCLAKNIYYESSGESIQGQFAVAFATLNRVKDPRYPDSVCEVIKQTVTIKSTNRKICAFSWYCEPEKRKMEIPLKNRDGSINQAAVDKFQIASLVAITALSGAAKDTTRGATHFHNPQQSDPSWKYNLQKTLSLGNHDFYKYPSSKK